MMSDPWQTDKRWSTIQTKR